MNQQSYRGMASKNSVSMFVISPCILQVYSVTEIIVIRSRKIVWKVV